MSKNILALLASALLLAIAGIGIASAVDPPPPPTMLRARVSADGTMVKGTTGASSDKLNTGDYWVRFNNHNVAGCIYQATLSAKKSIVTPDDPGSITVQPRYTNTKEVLVSTFAPGGGEADHGFDLVVFCWS